MKAKMTITEALQELKTLDKRIDSTREFILKYGIRQGSTIDPLDDEGGAHVAIPQRMQSLRDLFARKVSIRSAINKKNADTLLTLGGKSMTLAEWIVWRRDVFQKEIEAFRALQRQVIEARRQCIEKGMTLKDDGTQPNRVQEVSCFIPESKIQKEIETLQEIESTLDGKLSMINATTTVEV